MDIFGEVLINKKYQYNIPEEQNQVMQCQMVWKSTWLVSLPSQ